MADLKADFAKAQKDVKTLTKRPDNNDMLALYANFKQASDGDVAGSRPGMLDMVGRAKYDAWAKLKGTKPDAAMKAYVAGFPAGFGPCACAGDDGIPTAINVIHAATATIRRGPAPIESPASVTDPTPLLS